MRTRSLSRRVKVVSVGVLAAAAVAGGASAYAATDGPSAAGASSGGVSALAAASTSTSTSTSASAHGGKAGHHRKWWARRVIRAMGLHGEATTHNAKTGKYVDHEWQRGQVTAVNGSDLTVRSADGTTWTWVGNSATKVTRDGKKIAESALKSGDKVLVLGTRSGSANDARRVFAPQKQ